MEKMFLNWEEVKVHKKRMSLALFATFLAEAQIIPALMNTEQLIECCSKTIVNQEEKLTQFYQEKRLKTALKKTEVDKNDLSHLKIEGDPKISFPDFLLLLSRIASDIYKCGSDTKSEFSTLLEKFFRETLFLRTNTEVFNGVFPFVAKTKFSFFLMKMCANRRATKLSFLMVPDIKGNADSSAREASEEKEEENTYWDSEFKVEPVTLSVEEAIIKVSKYFMDKYTEDLKSTSRSSNKKMITVDSNSLKSEAFSNQQVLTIGVAPPVPKNSAVQRPTKLNIKNLKEMKSAEEHVFVNPQMKFNKAVLENYHKEFDDFKAFKTKIIQQADNIQFVPELMFLTLYPPPFYNQSEVSLIDCLIESGKNMNLPLALSAWKQLFEVAESENDQNSERMNYLYFLRGLMLLRQSEIPSALFNFDKCMQLYPKLTKQTFVFEPRASLCIFRIWPLFVWRWSFS